MLYFAYGSNLNQEDLREWCKSRRRPVLELSMRSIGLLEGRHLDFTAYSKVRNGGVADIVKNEHSCVYEVVFEVSPDQLAILNEKEGISSGQYKQSRVLVRLIPSGTVEDDILTYEVVTKKFDRYKPSREYLDVIIKGAEAYGLPPAWIEQPKSVGTA